MQWLSQKLGIIVASIMQWRQTRPEPVGMLEKLWGRVGASAALCLAPFFCRHPSVQNTILQNKVQWSCSALSLTRFQLSGTSSLFLSVILPLSVLSNLSFRLKIKAESYGGHFVRGHFRPNSSPQSCLWEIWILRGNYTISLLPSHLLQWCFTSRETHTVY